MLGFNWHFLLPCLWHLIASYDNTSNRNKYFGKMQPTDVKYMAQEKHFSLFEVLYNKNVTKTCVFRARQWENTEYRRRNEPTTDDGSQQLKRQRRFFVPTFFSVVIRIVTRWMFNSPFTYVRYDIYPESISSRVETLHNLSFIMEEKRWNMKYYIDISSIHQSGVENNHRVHSGKQARRKEAQFLGACRCYRYFCRMLPNIRVHL